MMKKLNPAVKWCLPGYWHDFQSVPRKIPWCRNVNSQQIANPPLGCCRSDLITLLPASYHVLPIIAFPKNLSSRIYHMPLSNTKSQSTQQKRSSRNLRSTENAAALPNASPASEPPAPVIHPATANDPPVKQFPADPLQRSDCPCVFRPAFSCQANPSVARRSTLGSVRIPAYGRHPGNRLMSRAGSQMLSPEFASARCQ